MRGRWFVAAAVVLLAFACAQAVPQKAGAPVQAIELAEPIQPEITLAGQKVQTLQGSYCWSYRNKATCADMVGPGDLIRIRKYAPVIAAPEAELRVVYSLKPLEAIHAARWKGDRMDSSELPADGTLKLPKEPGVYIYSVGSRWPQGSSEAVFAIEVREA